MSPVRTAVCSVALSFLAGSSALFAQDQPAGPPPADNQQQSAPANGAMAQGRRSGACPVHAGNPAGGRPTPPAETAPPAEPAPRATMDPNYSQGAAARAYPISHIRNIRINSILTNSIRISRIRRPRDMEVSHRRRTTIAVPIPAKLTIKTGTYITVRLNQGLSSDRNQVGDGFAATLAKPVIVDGVVVADRGQTLGGKVTEAKKAGRVEGVSRLAVQLTDLSSSDGQPVPIQTQLFSKNGPTSVGRDVGAVGATTATGAMIGAAAGWGTGAAIGAGAGAFVGIVGVLVTRGPADLSLSGADSDVPRGSSRYGFHRDGAASVPLGGSQRLRAAV